ncbi:hypothetical protein ACWGJP_08370 [Microbacterium sp. NPDC055903]
MIEALRTFGRILAAHWPWLIAWYLAGEAVHRVTLLLAGFVGGYTTLGGLLLLPLAVAARLISYVAMYLIVRPSLPGAALADSGGYRGFARAVLVSILPFFAFYAAWGMLDADRNEFFTIASGIALAETGYGAEAIGDRGGFVSVGALSVSVLVIALVLRLVLSRYQSRLPAWTHALAAYTEVLWTFMLFTLVGQWWAGVREWLSGRVGASWLQGIGDWFAANVAPVAVVWEIGSWLVGILIAVVIIPAAWLTVAGVIYGTSFGAETALGERWTQAERGAASTLARTLVLRLESLWAAVAVIWRGGPLLFGCTALAYALWALLERSGSRLVLQLIGGRDEAFWEALLPLILVGIAALVEPLRVAVVATAYDAVIRRPEAGLDTGAGLASGLDVEAGDDVSLAGDVEDEGPVGVIGNQEDGEDLVGR